MRISRNTERVVPVYVNASRMASSGGGGGGSVGGVDDDDDDDDVVGGGGLTSCMRKFGCNDSNT